MRFQAAVSLRHLIYDPDNRCAFPAAKVVVGETLPHLMQVLFTLMDQVGSDELVQVGSRVKVGMEKVV